jgi:hypothetical protein
MCGLGPFSPFTPFANRLIPFVFSSTNGQATNFRLHDEQKVSGFRKIFRFTFNVSTPSCFHVSMSMSQCLHVSMSPCLHVSMSPCLHVSISPCFHVSMFPCLHVSMSPCLHVSTSPCLHVHASTFLEFRKRKTELAENGNFSLFSSNGSGKLPVVFWKTDVCFPWLVNDKR